MAVPAELMKEYVDSQEFSNKYLKTMRKRVLNLGSSKRAGDGERSVTVEIIGKSLLSCKLKCRLAE